MDSEHKQSLISVLVMAYNHEAYIAECLNSILNQKTNFSFEIILGEDDSSDKTRAICIDFAEKYPDKIKLFLRLRKDVIYINGSPTGRFNFIESLKSCTGKYVALCDGDDYWTDPLKLQKQVDFLETNKKFGICFHNTRQLNTFDVSKSTIIPNTNLDINYSIEDFILSNRTATCSIVFNKDFLGGLPDWFYTLPFGDLGIISIVMKNSNKKGRVLKDIMGVYRLHAQSIHGYMHKNDKLLIKAYNQHILFTKIIRKELLYEEKYKKHIFKKYSETYKVLMNLHKKEKNIYNYYKFKLLNKFYSLKI
jgi:glycosyltransferase involved in cell wall biosynthesis